MRGYGLTLTGALALMAASQGCGPSATSGGADALVTNDPCTGSETRCVGASYQVCVNDTFVEDQSCGAQECDPGLGCVDCRPSWGRTCEGDDVHECLMDGTVGPLIETCDFEQCNGGSCGGGDDCSAASQLIYVVDETYRLLSFDPQKLDTLQDPFTLIGSLNCPSGPAWPEWLGGSTPFSMSVDRNATAWVLYTSGEIFHVSTTDASCQATSFVKGQSGFKLFGMGFVSNSPGSSDETLWIAGGDVDAAGAADLGSVNPGTLGVTRIGTLPNAEFSPELTGTGDAELYGYYPGISSSMIGNIVKTNATHSQSWPMPGLGNQISAWAFAHWGGQFYIFVTTTDAFGFTDSQVLLMDPVSGNTTPKLSDLPYVIVGAGVSTCAPIVVP